MDLSDIRALYAYNRWANQKTLQTAAKLTGDSFIRPMGNSFSSVRDTLAHILGAEWIWLERWHGSFPQTLLDPADFPTVDKIKLRLETVEQGRERFIEALTIDRFRQELAYINRSGERFSYPLWQQMIHVVNHSSYHRGQITTLLRQMGAQAVSTDFLTYYDENQPN